MTTLGTATLIGATLATAMVAGLLFSFAHSVMPGLGTLEDRDFLAAFQRIDSAIANPWMMATFLGAPVLTLAALLLHLPGHHDAAPWLRLWLGLALALGLATVIITGAIHLPLNAGVQDAAPGFADAAELRAGFEDRWARWNFVRTLTSTGSLAALCWALTLSGRTAG